jgi:predicted NUDIX family NTP pyrophosphohydrolase
VREYYCTERKITFYKFYLYTLAGLLGKKDAGAWSIPKGEFDEGEDALVAAKREFEEELGKRFL